jgi:acetyl-CoA carboxylase carboxyltransferase component
VETIKSWEKKRQQALGSGGADKVARQYKLGKKTARERLALLLDEQSFEETDQLATSPHLAQKFLTDGVITGFGKIQGRTVAIYSQDFTIKGGSLGARHAQKICKIMDLASKIGCPVIGILDSGGARIDEGIHSLAGYGDIFLRNARYSGIVPQISIILGPCAGGAVYSPALTDFIFTTENISQLFITGPQVIKKVLNQDVTKEELGGAHVHATKSGVVHFVEQTEADCFAAVKRLLSYLPDNYRSYATQQAPREPLAPLLPTPLPENPNKPYNMLTIIEGIVDSESFFEVQKLFAPNIITGFAHIEGFVVGIVANQPVEKAGTLDIDASCKAARFINTCNNFNIPIVSLVDVPGFLAGVDQEHNGIIRHGAKLLYAYACTTTPKITIILRKSYGGAYIVMGSKHLGADFVYAWPMAQIAVLGAHAAVEILHGSFLKELENTEAHGPEMQKRLDEYTQEYLHPFTAAQAGYIDAIIEPSKTRHHIAAALKICQEKVEHTPPRKSGNIPL